MVRIFISDELHRKAKEYGKYPFHIRRPNFSKPTDKLMTLKERLVDASHKTYIQRIIDRYDKLNYLKPSQVSAEKEAFDLIVPEDQLSDEINGIYFHELIVEAMRYTDLREKDFIPYIKIIGTKSCVYCNAQLAIVTDNEGDKMIARLELDHYFPKSKYPFLCTSFFNLYPTCGCCNRLKGSKPLAFQLYTENIEDEVNPFYFHLDDESITNYLEDYDDEKLEIHFTSKGDENTLALNHDKLLGIKGIYNTQKDVAAELIYKKQIYTDSYKDELVSKYPALFPDIAILNRLIIGNYDKVEEINKRPLAKFTQDIAKQLKLIK